MLAITGLSFAQLGFSLDTQSGYASNAFANYNTLPDYYTTINASLNNDWINEERGVRWFYSGSLDAFKKYTSRTYQNHSIGLNYYRNFNDGGNRLDAGFNVSKRVHSEDYKWYEMAQYYGYANAKFIISDQTFGYFGINVRWRDYTYLDAFSHSQTILFARLSRFFDSGTTLILEMNMFSKSYFPESNVSTLENLPEIVTIGDGNSQQFVGLVKAAQSLNATTGLSMQFLMRRNIISSVRYLGTSTGYYYSDEELFDDVYGYNGEELNATLKKHLPWRMQLSLGSSMRLKHYDQRLALDLEGNPFADERLREDKRLSGWISLVKSFKLNTSMRPLSISFNWSTFNNISNDPYYDYSSSFFTFGFSQDF